MMDSAWMPSESRLPSASYTSLCRARSRRPSNFGDTISTLKCVSASAAPVGLPACTRHVSGAFTTQINAPHAGQHRVRTGRNESHARSTFGLLRVLADAAATLQRRKRLQHDGGALSVPWPRAQSDCAPYAADRTPRGLETRLPAVCQGSRVPRPRGRRPARASNLTAAPTHLRCLQNAVAPPIKRRRELWRGTAHKGPLLSRATSTPTYPSAQRAQRCRCSR